MKKIILSLLIATSPLLAMHKQQQLSQVIAFSKTCAKSRESLGELQLLKYQDNFYVAKNGVAKLIKGYDIDPLLKNMNEEQLLKYFEQNGYIQIDQLANQDFVLKAKGRIKGGGPVAGAIAYWATKTLCYGTALAGAGTVVVATGGLAGGVAGGALAGAGTILGGAATPGMIIAGGVIGGAGLASEAAIVTAATVSGAGGVAGAVAAVETVSVGVSALFTMIPFLP